MYNPYEDFTTHKMNQILVEGGFAPEWITLQRDIGEAKTRIRDQLDKQCRVVVKKAYEASQQVQFDWRDESSRQWRRHYEALFAGDEEVKTLNKNIDKYNLMVPMLNAQMFQFNVIKEAKAVHKSVMEELDSGDPSDIKEKLTAQRETKAPVNRTPESTNPINLSSASDDTSVWTYLKNEFTTYFNQKK